jgi:hypothetical protein
MDAKNKIDFTQACAFLTPISDSAIPVDWEASQEAGFSLGDLEKTPQPGARFADLPAAAAQAKSYNAWTRDFTTWLYGMQKLELFRSPSLKQVSNPGEVERDFRVRLQIAFREQRDEAVEALRKKYTPRLITLQERLRRAQQAQERETAQARDAGVQTAISFGATLLSALAGRKTTSRSNIGRATTAMRGVSRTMEQRQDIERAGETVAAVKAQLDQIQAQFKEESDTLVTRIDPLTEELETIMVKPKKTDIVVQLVSLTWSPFWQDSTGSITPAW